MGEVILNRKTGLLFFPIKIIINETFYTIKYNEIKKIALPQGKYSIKGDDSFLSEGSGEIEVYDEKTTEVTISTIIPNLVVFSSIGILLAAFILAFIGFMPFYYFSIVLLVIVVPVFLISVFKKKSYIKFRSK